MNLGIMTFKRVQDAVRGLMKQFQQREEPLVLAITNRYPTRIALYAAAFQGNWRVHFMKSLREAAEASQGQRPIGVFYDQSCADPAWGWYCSSLSGEGIPFVFLADKSDDEIFLNVMAAGGYLACSDPLTSEEIVKAMDLAGEFAGLVNVPVV